MIYKIYAGNYLIYDSRDDKSFIVNPTLELEVNKAGSLSFTILPGDNVRDIILRMRSTITVLRDRKNIFTGRVIEYEDDFNDRRSVYCEGALAFFNDSVQPLAEYHGMTVRGYLEKLVSVHNSQVENNRKFTVGVVTARDANDSLYRYTNYNSTITEIKEDLVDDLGGYLFVRNENGTLYLDYLGDFLDTSDQKIEFGENLLDFTRGFNATDLATRIIPLGAVLEGEEDETIKKRLTIDNINDGKNYVENEEAVKKFGKITKTVIWDDVTTETALLSKAKKYLSESQFDNMTIECRALDLHYADGDIPAFSIGQYVWVISNPHGLKKRFPVSKLVLSLDNVADNTITLGTTERSRTLTGASVDANADILRRIENIPDPHNVLAEAKRNATALIKMATHGYVVTEPNEILIMDTKDKTTAKKIWRWNQGGLGFSKTGYEGEYPLAITQDGAIVADYITAGKLNANLIKTGMLSDMKGTNYWNMETGEFSLQTGKIGEISVENIEDAVTKGIIDVDVEYAQNDSSTTAPTSGWSTKAPAWADGKYMWQRTKTTTADGEAEYSAATCISGAAGKSGAPGSSGSPGKDGKNGSDGKGVTSIVEQYYLSTSNEKQEGGSWQTTCPAWKSGTYIWTRSAVTWTDKTTTYTTPTLANGINTANTNANSAKTTVNNLKIGCRNLVFDGCFANTSAKWTAWGTPATRETVKIGGKTWLHIVSNTKWQGLSQNRSKRFGNNDYKEIEPGTYMVSVMAYAKAATKLSVGFHWFKTGSTTIESEVWATFDVTTAPKRYSKQITVPANITGFNVMVGMYNDTAAEFWMSELMFEAGNKASAYTPAPEDLQSYADMVSTAAVNNQTQTSIFNKLTNNGQTQGIYLKDGKLYINAEYIATGILKSKDGQSFYLDLDKGILKMNATQLSVTGSTLTNLWRNSAFFNYIGTTWLNASSGDRGIWMGDSNNATNGEVAWMDINNEVPDGVPVMNSLWIKPYITTQTPGVGQTVAITAGRYMFSFYYRAILSPNLLRNTADKKLDSSITDTGWFLTSNGNGKASVVTGYNNLGTTDRYILPYPLAYAITGNTTGIKDFAQKVSLTKGTTYVLSWYSRLVGGTTSATILVRNWNTTTNACELTLFNAKMTNTAWERRCVKFTATNETSEITNIQFGVSGAGNVQFACMKLEQADYCSLYVPHTADASYKESDRVYYRVLHRWGMNSSYGIYDSVSNTIAEIKSKKWNRHVVEETFTKNKDVNGKRDLMNSAYFESNNNGRYNTGMRVATMNGISIEFCGLMLAKIAKNDNLQAVAAACKWVPNGSDQMYKDSIVATMNGSSATDSNQGLYLNSSGQLCINASMIKSGTISADKIKTGTLSSIAINNNGNFQVNSGGSVTIKSGNLTVKESDSKLIRFNTSSGIPQIHLTDGSRDTLITPGHIYYTNNKGVYTELTNH
ncbi:phage tail spike protein [Butyrivibrio sp. MB2005]|uniref:phage tail spike protein n=1 Tax=Butyrivibrio sp. MB2005 TaxID=1280678 RepID=UPI00068596AE|nr:phage tail spike protein [Butyrivibrio sp. MB2005]